MMDYRYELTVKAKTAIEKEEFKKYWKLSFIFENEIIQETSNTILYSFILDMILCYEVLPELYKLYPKLKFKLSASKYEYDLDCRGMIRGKLLFGAFRELKGYDKFMVNVIDYSPKIYRDKIRLLFKKMVKSKYLDGSLIYDFFEIINTYFYYRADEKEYIKKRKLFFELSAKFEEPLLKEYLEKEYIQNFKIETTTDGL